MGFGATIRNLIEHEERLNAFCLNVRGQLGGRPCSHGATLDPRWLSERLGRDDVGLYDPDLQRRLVCKRCRSRGASFIVAPPTWSTSAGGRESRREA
jgi:hypothetical protein